MFGCGLDGPAFIHSQRQGSYLNLYLQTGSPVGTGWRIKFAIYYHVDWSLECLELHFHTLYIALQCGGTLMFKCYLSGENVKCSSLVTCECNACNFLCDLCSKGRSSRWMIIMRIVDWPSFCFTALSSHFCFYWNSIIQMYYFSWKGGEESKKKKITMGWRWKRENIYSWYAYCLAN